MINKHTQPSDIIWGILQSLVYVIIGFFALMIPMIAIADDNQQYAYEYYQYYVESEQDTDESAYYYEQYQKYQNYAEGE